MQTVLLAGIAGMVAVLATARGAAAQGQLHLDRTQLDLSDDAPAASLTLRNDGPAVLRIELSAVGWRESVDGTMELAPTTALVVRPSLIELAPGAARSIRVGTTARGRAHEQSYRVFVNELPDRSVQRTNVQVLTRIGVPVFVAPQRASTGARVALALDGTAAIVRVHAIGSLHLKLATVTVRGHTPDAAAWTRAITGWYVLPGVERRFTVDLAGASCAGASHLVAEVRDHGGTAWTSAPLPCPR